MSKHWSIRDQRQLLSKHWWVRLYARLHYAEHGYRYGRIADRSTKAHYKRYRKAQKEG